MEQGLGGAREGSIPEGQCDWRYKQCRGRRIDGEWCRGISQRFWWCCLRGGGGDWGGGGGRTCERMGG